MNGKGGGAHAPDELLARYASGDTAIGPDVLWALEAHLEDCAACRSGLVPDSATVELLDRVRTGIDLDLNTPARRRILPRGLRWTAPTFLRWTAITTLMVLLALLLDLVGQSVGKDGPPMLLLLAPVVPLLGVAAVWARGTDPAYELVAATPRAGLYLVLRRTLTVLAVVVPALAAAGLAVGASPALWLLPCLAFTAGTLALGSVIGVPRAATVLAVAWTAGVIGPGLLTNEMPAVLAPSTVPAWAALTVAVAVVVVLRRDTYTQLPSGR